MPTRWWVRIGPNYLHGQRSELPVVHHPLCSKWIACAHFYHNYQTILTKAPHSQAKTSRKMADKHMTISRCSASAQAADTLRGRPTPLGNNLFFILIVIPLQSNLATVSKAGGGRDASLSGWRGRSDSWGPGTVIR